MRPVYGRSPWIDRFPKSRVPSYPKLRGELSIDVAIVGGGLTGCMTAYALAAAGIKVALVEADRIGRGASGGSNGWITQDPATSYATTEAAIGRRSARHAWQAWRRAALDFAALLRRLEIKTRAESHPALVVARTPAEAATLAREQKLRREVGVDAAGIPARGIAAAAGFAGIAAMRSTDTSTIDPYRTTVGLAAAAASRGALVFERSPVVKTSFTRTTSALTVGASIVRTSRIIVTTGLPGALFKPLQRHVPARTAHLVLTDVVPARLRRALGSRDYLVRDVADPPHRIAWVDDERLLVSGADSDPVPPRIRDQVLVQRTGQLMYELSVLYPDISGLQPAYGWDAPYGTTATGLPVIGPHRNYPFHLFAFGDSSHGVTGAYLASRILLRHHLGDPQPADAAFAFRR
jgi:glycine/D-amino acid oxidase-like deaminating enzyme